jgi:streptogramin lyase
MLDPARILGTIPLPLPVARLAGAAGAVWALSTAGNALLRIDPQTNQLEVPPIPLDFSPWNLTTGEGSVWITGNDADLIARLDPATNRVAATFAVGPHPIAQAALGFGALWTANAGGSTAGRIDLVSGAVTSFRAGRQPHGVAVGAGAVWVGNHDEGAVVRLDPRTAQIQARIPLSSEPHTLAFGAGYLWADGYHVAGLLQIDPATNRLRNDVIALGFESDMFAVDDKALWIASVPTNRDGVDFPGTREIVQIDPVTQAVVVRLQFATPPQAVALAPDALWVAFADPPTLVRLRR